MADNDGYLEIFAHKLRGTKKWRPAILGLDLQVPVHRDVENDRVEICVRFGDTLLGNRCEHAVCSLCQEYLPQRNVLKVHILSHR